MKQDLDESAQDFNTKEAAITPGDLDEDCKTQYEKLQENLPVPGGDNTTQSKLYQAGKKQCDSVFWFMYDHLPVANN
jgi:hypothetical protein